MDNKIFISNLRRLRLEKGYTQEQLAELLGVSAQSVSRWECGNTLPDVLLLPSLAQLYGITVDDLYRPEINAYPNYAQRLLSVYESSGRTEDFLLAEQEFRRLLAGEHTADDLRSFGVLYHYMTKRCAKLAQEHLDAALETAHRSHWVWSSSAQQKIALLCDLGRGKEEAARYEQQLSTDPSDPMLWLLCVSAWHYAGELMKACDLVQQAIEKFPDSPALHVYAGDICRALKRYEEAFRYWQRVLELDDSFLDALYSMGFCYEELEQFDKALAVWQDLYNRMLSKGLLHESQLPQKHITLCRERLS